MARNTGLSNVVTLGNSANNFSGGFTIGVDNTVITSAANVIPLANIVTDDGAWNLNGNNQLVNALSGAGSIDLGSGTLTISNNSSSKTFSGSITGSGGLVKGPGTSSQTLSGSSTFSGGISITGGTLYFQTNGNGSTIVGAAGTGPLTIA
ncbi:MAG: hypothetical protein M3Y82_11935, partial [Verrucomicrobiota bacterium]|nr:hypothetical protein [Verrucomicrobiota bacterium]